MNCHNRAATLLAGLLCLLLATGGKPVPPTATGPLIWRPTAPRSTTSAASAPTPALSC